MFEELEARTDEQEVNNTPVATPNQQLSTNNKRVSFHNSEILYKDVTSNQTLTFYLQF